MASGQNVYQKLLSMSQRIAVYHSIQSLLSWDQETYMPAKAIEMRALQIQEMATLAHQQKTSKEFAENLGQLIDLHSGIFLDKTLTGAQQAAVREWRRDYLRNSKLPEHFVEIWAKTTSQSVYIWQQAKQQNKFSLFAPYLEKIVSLNQQKAEFLGYVAHPYDALLSLYEPDITTALLDDIFARLKVSLQAQVKKIVSSAAYSAILSDGKLLQKDFSVEKQWQFSHKLLTKLGFHPNSSRLDQSAHPFCMRISPQDVRMTSKVLENSLMTHVFAVLHESGHAMYCEGLRAEHYGSPLGEEISLGIHESQSRWWETFIGRTEAFWAYYYTELQNDFPDPFKGITLKQFYRLINLVQPSLIRIYADEVTYNLHIILRFELEKSLIEGSLLVKDLAEAWNEKMEKYLGIRPLNDAEGCLQDIHWSMGGMGYFPTYTLGNLYAAQFFKTFSQHYPDWQLRVSKGEFGFIRQWLQEKIHQHGRQYTPQEIVHQVTGAPLDEAHFLHYLKEKYTVIYP